jgi:transcriptional regulator with XRE-family HTH domain
MNPGTEQLSRLLEARGLRQKEAAEEAGLSETKMSLILNGKAVPNLREAVRLRKAFGLDPAVWLEGKEAGNDDRAD